MSSFLFSSYLLHFNCKFVALKTKKILSTNHHYGNPSTRFSVEPKKRSQETVTGSLAP